MPARTRLMVMRAGPCWLRRRGLLAAAACSAAIRARALAKVSAMFVLAELLYWNAALVIGTLGKVGRAACMGSPVEGKRKARSAVAAGLGGWRLQPLTGAGREERADALEGVPGEVEVREGREAPGSAKPFKPQRPDARRSGLGPMRSGRAVPGFQPALPFLLLAAFASPF